MSIFDFFTREAGQERRRALEGLLTQFIPPEMRPQLGLLAEANPVVSMERAGQDAQQLFAPDQTIMDRIASLGRMSSNIAGTVAPAVVAGRAGVPVANAVQDMLTGYAPAVQPFLVDDFGGVGLPRAADAAAERGAQVMDMLRSGRSADVTDAMLDMGDPVLNARLNEYLYRNYDLPMDAASRAARAKDFDTSGYHGTRNDFTAFSPPRKAGVDGFSTQQPVFAGYDPSVANEAARPLGGNVIPLRARLSSVFDPEAIQDAPDARWLDDSWSPLGRKLVDDAGAGRLGNDIDDPEGYAAAVAAGQWDVIESDAFQKWMRAQGFDDFRVNEAGAQNFAVTNPERIRSRFARFDPRLSHLRNLNAALAAGVPLGLLAMQPQEEQY